MDAMRGAALSDYDVAQGEMRLIDVDETDEEKLPLVYQPEILEEYYKRRPHLVVQRTLQLAGAFGGFMTSLAIDAARGTLKTNEVKRAAELREIITSLGPFYIKLGQALSIRPDILSPKAMVELQRLCDKVPSYDSKIAMATIERELGKPVLEVYSEITPEPLAAASLGQGRTDLVALLDEFAYRFYEELDYQKECENGIRIRADMAHIAQVVIPFNYPEFTSRRVFTAEWIDGEKLSQSQAGDVNTLVNVGVVAYLTQLLDTGLFHADPHPGNLIRTPDGRLAILDFGLMTEITDDQKYGMIEAISHLVHRDYGSIGDDFKRLDFIPAHVDVTPIVPALKNVFDAALAGGGAKSINFQDLAGDLAQITFEYPFRIPPYFALVIRAIGVLEGIALVGNPSFAIIDEAYPYISKRLLTDESPRLRAALRYMIYGKSDVFDVERLIDLLQAFESFVEIRDDKAGVVAANGGTMTGAEPDSAAEQTREALRFLFSKDGEFFREFLTDEVVRGADCIGRDAARELAYTVGLRGANIPGFIKAAAPPLSSDDRKVVDNTRRLIAFFMGDAASGFAANDRPTPYDPAEGLFGLRVNLPAALDLLGVGGRRDTPASRLQAEIAPVLRELGPEMRAFGLTIVGRLTEKLATRVLRYTSDR
ncbi:hypothetical protein JKP88DRAFT_271995 [Tribonema minus]|uniref:ABC1 atypical kinase-like domain-containing protein n=1 Tax=Tribonema minus TaxID=303371 RepID=A0A836CGN4_9STRA|nr:hypothetical protein JKP88DRAFT_271995 [Tribonema minus]